MPVKPVKHVKRPTFGEIVRVNAMWHTSSLLFGGLVLIALPVLLVVLALIGWLIGSLMDPRVIWSLKTGRLP